MTRHAIGATLLATIAAAATAVVGPVVGIQPVGPRPPADLPHCQVGDEPALRTSYDEWADTLLDTAHRLPADYVPPDLVRVDAPGGPVRLRAFVVADLRELLDAARAAGQPVRVTSAYRGHADQQALFNAIVDEHGRQRALRSVARAGHSEHQLGTVVDLAGGHDWLRRHAWRYGFVLSYPAGRSPSWTCYIAEPWHFRYFGRQRAALMHDSGLSPREWLWLNQYGGAQQN